MKTTKTTIFRTVGSDDSAGLLFGYDIDGCPHVKPFGGDPVEAVEGRIYGEAGDWWIATNGFQAVWYCDGIAKRP